MEVWALAERAKWEKPTRSEWSSRGCRAGSTLLRERTAERTKDKAILRS